MPSFPNNSSPLSLSSSKTQAKFAEKMQEMEHKELERQAQVFALTQGLPYIYLVSIPILPGPLGVIPVEDAQRLKMVCFDESAKEKRVAVLDSRSPEVRDYIAALAEKHHTTISVNIMSATSLEAVLKLYARLPKITEEVAGVAISEADLAKYSEGFNDIRKVQEALKNITLTETLTALIAIAMQSRASDIHVEAEEENVVVRLRIDGVLHEVALLDHAAWPKIISRVKLLSGLKINIADRPQDGRFTIFVKGDKVDVRVSTLPTSYGESVVMRLLRSTSAGLSFSDLGLSDYNAALLKKEIEKPNGMIVNTGPTGSGKTTTLYAILNTLNSKEVKIITLEDPVEYKLKGINQSQIDMAKGYTFAAGLRSILRQDPDIVMVGEIRDLETADIAINAALTGHLVISTIHTNSAAGAVPRFLAMGVKSFLLAPAVSTIIGQRLVRRLCPTCKKEIPLTEEQKARAIEAVSKISPVSGITVDMAGAHFFGPVGCEACYGLGYKGRMAIYEIMSMNSDLEKAILADQVSEYAIADIAMQHGMITMLQDGLLRAIEGVTSVEEVFSVTE